MKTLHKQCTSFHLQLYSDLYTERDVLRVCLDSIFINGALGLHTFSS